MNLEIKELLPKHVFLWKEYSNFISINNINECDVKLKYFIYHKNKINDLFIDEQKYMYNQGNFYNHKYDEVYDHGCGYIFIELEDKKIIKFRLSTLDCVHEYNINQIISQKNTDIYHLKLLQNSGFSIPDDLLSIVKPDNSKYFVSIFYKNANYHDVYTSYYKLIECVIINNTFLDKLKLSNEYQSNNSCRIIYANDVNLDKNKYYLYFDGKDYVGKNCKQNTIKFNQNEVKILLFDIIKDNYFNKLFDSSIKIIFDITTNIFNDEHFL
jgi:hypothetical protein